MTTLLIIAVTTVISLLGFQQKQLCARLMYTSSGLKQGQYERLLTHGFVHADGAHLLFNMFTLYFFGAAIEQAFAMQAVSETVVLGFVLFYLVGIVVAILPTWWAERNNMRYASLGASGAVCAVLYFYVVKNPTSMLYLFGVVPIPALLYAVGFVVYGLVEQRRGRGRINHSAHLSGSAFGVLAGFVL